MDYALVIWRHRVLVAGLILVALLGTFGLTLMIAMVYKARATLIAPKEGSGSLLTGLTTPGVLHTSRDSRSPLWQ